MLQMRAEGKTFREIAESFGVSQRTVRSAIDKEFQRLTNERNEVAQDLLATTVGRLDALLQAVWDQALAGDLEAVKTAASICEKQARIAGVLQPKEREASVTVNVFGDLEERARALGLAGLEALRGPEPPRLVEVYDAK